MRLHRDGGGGWSVRVKPHEQSDADRVELANAAERLVREECGIAGEDDVRRRLAAWLPARVAKGADPEWLSGCVWAAARASGVKWSRDRCAAEAAELCGRGSS